MLSLQEISDRLEIQDLLARYSHAIDRRDWNALDRVFTPDALIDYTSMGGARGTLPEIKQYLAQALAHFKGFQHLVATTDLTLTGDTALGRTICHNPMIMEVDGADWIFFCGLWYVDKFVRTAEGWRICERIEEKSHFFNLPPSFAPPPTTISA
jgi:ketosteroid isomerase-like protein